MLLTQNQLETFNHDGFILVEDLFDLNEIATALNEMEKTFYDKSFAEYLEKLDKTGKSDPDPVANIGPTGIFGRAQFPTGINALDRLIENEAYLDIFAQCLGTNDISYCNAHLFMRSGPTDTRHSEHPWQSYHIDNPTNTFLPASHAVGSFDYVNSSLYLHDVDENSAPMHAIPGSHRQAADVILRFNETYSIEDIREVPEFAEPVPTSAKVGSALFYSSYLVHAAVPFKNKRKQRALWSLSMTRSDTSRFINPNMASPWNGPEQQFFQIFWEKTTPRVRTLFGWAKEGHPYYTETTLKSISMRFPKMDLSPYQVRIDS